MVVESWLPVIDLLLGMSAEMVGKESLMNPKHVIDLFYKLNHHAVSDILQEVTHDSNALMNVTQRLIE